MSSNSRLTQLTLLVFFSLFGRYVRAEKKINLETDSVIIKISYRTTFESNKSSLDIYSTKNGTKIVYSVFDSTKNSKLSNDTTYQRLKQGFENKVSKNFMTDTALMKLLIRTIDKYAAYSTDSVLMNNSTLKNYLELISQVTTASREDLEQKELNKNRIVLDGMTVKYQITSISGIRNLYARSPTITSHPLLYKLWTQTSEIYRREKNKNSPLKIQ